MIPMHKFEFVDLSELFSLASSYENPESPTFATGESIYDFSVIRFIKIYALYIAFVETM